MLNKWLGPAIEKRVEEVAVTINQNQLITELERQYKKLFNELAVILSFEQKDVLYSIDTIKNDILRYGVELAYKNGFNDGVQIHKCAEKLKI